MPTLGKLDIEVISSVKEEIKKCVTKHYLQEVVPKNHERFQRLCSSVEEINKCVTKHYLQEVVPKNHERFQRLCSSVEEINKCQEELETLKWWFRVMDMHEETIRKNTGTSEIEKI